MPLLFLSFLLSVSQEGFSDVYCLWGMLHLDSLQQQRRFTQGFFAPLLPRQNSNLST